MLQALLILFALQLPVNGSPFAKAPCMVTVDGRLLYPAYATPIPHTSVDIYNDDPFPTELYSDAYSQFHVTLEARGYSVVVNAEGMERVRQRFSVPNDQCLPNPGIKLDIMLHPAARPAAESEDTVSIESLARKIPPGAVHAFEKVSPDVTASLTEILKTTPDYYDASLALGLQYKKNGKRDEAIQMLSHALEINPGSMLARAALGQYSYEANDFKRAAELLSEAARLGNTTSGVYYMLGSSYIKLDQLDLAEASLLRSLKITPTVVKAHMQLYNVYMNRQQPDKALKEADTYLEAYPDAPDRKYVQGIADQLRQTLKPKP